MKNSTLVLGLTFFGLIVLVAGSLYFGAPLFGWLIVLSIFAVFLWASFNDYKNILQVEREAIALHKWNGTIPNETEVSGFFKERILLVKALSKSEKVNVETCLDILNAKIDLKGKKSASGVVILLGLMGTFFGLMLSVSTAGSSIDNSSTAATMNTVHSIFSSMKGIFGTSLCGIFASLILSAIHSLSRRATERFFADLDFYTVSTLYPAFCSNVNSNASFEEKLVKQVVNSFENAFENVKTSFSKTHVETVLSMQSVSKELTESFKTLLKNVSDEFAGTRTLTLKTVQEMLEQFKNGLTLAVEGSVSSIQNVKESFPTEIQNGILTLSKSIDDSLKEQTKKASDEWNALMSRFSSIAENMAQKESDRLSSLKEESIGLAETLTVEIGKINTNVDANLKTLLQELSENVKRQIENSENAWNNFMKNLETASLNTEKNNREGLETLANVAVQVAERAQAGSAALSKQVENEIEKLSNDVQTSFKTLAETSSALVDAQKRLLEGVENRVVKENEASETLTSNINEAATLMRVNQSEFSAGLEMFNKGLEALLEKLSGDTEEKGEEEGLVEQIRHSLELFHERASEILVENAVKTQEILLEILEQSQRAALSGDKTKDA